MVAADALAPNWCQGICILHVAKKITYFQL